MMRKALTMLALAALVMGGVPGAAQEVRTIDPNQAIDGDLQHGQSAPQQQSTPVPADQPRYSDQRNDPGQSRYPDQQRDSGQQHYPDQNAPSDPYAPPAGQRTQGDVPQPVLRQEARTDAARGDTFNQEEVLSAAEGTFGKGAAGLAGIVERTLKEQGRPNAYISGREAGGAIVLGLRYGGGTLFHKVEGQMPVHWTGPSVGFDLGGDASKVFVLVYNLYDSEDLFKRFPAGEGRLYFVGGFAATYMRRGNIVLIPIRLGVGWRQGVNLGYMKFSHKGKILPF